jgi:hypothetical protein
MKIFKRVLFFLLLIIIIFITIGGSYWIWAQRPQKESPQLNIDALLESRKKELLTEGSSTDPFGEDDLVRILLIGLDSRMGKTNGHCDAIQLLEINRKTNRIQITAVPRGTYSPLPPGKKYIASDYYVSNACGFGGLEYGVAQIEKILGKKADYLVVIGFSETLGILRKLNLPTTETLQWLRLRQGYAIGEPQRAHNHSTFIKQQLINLAPKINSQLTIPWQFLVYKIVSTDLSFEQSREIALAISQMNIDKHPERISLAMKPPHAVQEIAYDPIKVAEYLKSMLDPIKHLLSKEDYAEITKANAQERILILFNSQKEDTSFITWAWENGLWLQIDDDTAREVLHYEILSKYISSLTDKKQIEKILEDYIIEMDELELKEWVQKGRALLKVTLTPLLE